MWLRVERESYLVFGNRVGSRKIKSTVYMAMDQKAQEGVEVDSRRDGSELLRIAKQRVGEKKDFVRVSCLKDESRAVEVSVDDRKENLEGPY